MLKKTFLLTSFMTMRKMNDPTEVVVVDVAVAVVAVAAVAAAAVAAVAAFIVVVAKSSNFIFVLE